MKNRSKVFFKYCVILFICCCVAAFALSIALVKRRQLMISIGRKIFELEKNLASYAVKNAELDAKILQLSGSESLRSIIVENGLVAMSDKNTVKVSGARANLYSVARRAGAFANEFAPNKISKQTNLTIRNQ